MMNFCAAGASQFIADEKRYGDPRKGGEGAYMVLWRFEKKDSAAILFDCMKTEMGASRSLVGVLRAMGYKKCPRQG